MLTVTKGFGGFVVLAIGVIAGLGLAMAWSFAPFRFPRPGPWQIIVHSWEPTIPTADPPLGGGQYGVILWSTDLNGETIVRGMILIDPYGVMFQDLGELDRVASRHEAIRDWGTVVWDDAGLTLGTLPKQVSVSRDEYQSHR